MNTNVNELNKVLNFDKDLSGHLLGSNEIATNILLYACLPGNSKVVSFAHNEDIALDVRELKYCFYMPSIEELKELVSNFILLMRKFEVISELEERQLNEELSKSTSCNNYFKGSLNDVLCAIVPIEYCDVTIDGGIVLTAVTSLEDYGRCSVLNLSGAGYLGKVCSVLGLNMEIEESAVADIDSKIYNSSWCWGERYTITNDGISFSNVCDFNDVM